MTRSTKAAVIGLLLVLIVAAVALVFNRCERNFSLAGKWDELTADVVENF